MIYSVKDNNCDGVKVQGVEEREVALQLLKAKTEFMMYIREGEIQAEGGIRPQGRCMPVISPKGSKP